MKRKGSLAGVLVLSSVLLAPWTGDAKPPDRSGKCQSKKVNAASIFIKKLFYAEAALLKNANYSWDQAVEEAEHEFIQRWNQAEDTDQCDFPWEKEIDLGGGSGEEQKVSFYDIAQLLGWIEGRTSEIADLILDQVNDQQIGSINLGG